MTFKTRSGSVLMIGRKDQLVKRSFNPNKKNFTSWFAIPILSVPNNLIQKLPEEQSVEPTFGWF